MQVPSWHTPDEWRRIVDLAHVMEGIVIGGAALTMIWEARAGPGNARNIWPRIVIAAGVALLLYLFVPTHGLSTATAQWTFIVSDSQQRLHGVIAVLIASAGWIELQHRRARVAGRAWGFAWPAALAIIGILFFVHQQHGTDDAVATALRLHRYIGLSLLAAAVPSTLNAVRPQPSRWLTLASAAALLITACLLVAYREPLGAYEMHIMPG